MPTAAKLVAAMAFFIVGFAAAEAFKPGMPEGTPFGHFNLIVGGIGGLSGWIVMGRMAGKGWGNAIGIGLQTSITLTFFALLLFCIYLMLGLATKMRYDGPMDAIVGVFALMLEHGAMLLTVPVLGVLGIGGILGGLMAEWASRRWR